MNKKKLFVRWSRIVSDLIGGEEKEEDSKQCAGRCGFHALEVYHSKRVILEGKVYPKKGNTNSYEYNLIPHDLICMRAANA